MRNFIQTAAPAAATVVLCVGGCLMGGCNGRVVELGGTPSRALPAVSNNVSDSASTGGPVSGAPACPLAPTADAGAPPSPVDPAALASIAGTWTGYVEAYSFPESGSGAVTLVVMTSPHGGTEATITFGDEPAPAPPTSAGGPFPVGDDDAGGVSFPPPHEGFPYTAYQASFDGARLRLSVVSHEPWKPWCALQTSYGWPIDQPELCSCLPDWNSFMGTATSTNPTGCELQNPDTHQWVAVSCEQASLCNPGLSMCLCSESGCTLDMSRPDVLIDARLTGGAFDGTVTGLPSSPLGLHLMAQTPGDAGADAP